MNGRLDIEACTRDPELVAFIAAADEVFTWLNRSFIVPVGWTALALGGERDPILLPSGSRCEATAGVGAFLLVRESPVECTADEPRLRSSDGHDCRGTVHLLLRAIPELTELAALRRTVLGSNTQLRSTDLGRQVDWPLRQALVQLAGRHTAEQLLGTLDTTTVRRVIDEHLGGFCLAGGMTVEGPVQVAFESPGFVEHQRAEAHLRRHQARHEARAAIQAALSAARRDELSQMVGLLEKLRDANAAHSEQGLRDLLKTFGESQRGQMYEALWHLAPGSAQTAFIAVVSELQVLLFDPREPARPARLIPLPDVLGPLRSIRADSECLRRRLMLIGAATGVHQVAIDTGCLQRSLRAEIPQSTSVKGGVNAASMGDGWVYATHSELGLLAWDLSAADSLAEQWYPDITSPADTVRGATAADGSLWFTTDETVWSIPLADGPHGRPQAYRAGDQTLSALTVEAGMVFAGTVQGEILAWDIGEPDHPRVLRGKTGEPVGSVDVIEAGGVDRLIVADRTTALTALVVGDVYTCRYEAGTQTIRRAAAAEDVLAAMHDARDRLLVWSPNEPRRPRATIIIPHLTGGRIQDLCLIPTT